MTFTLSKEVMPDSFNGTDRMKFSDWEFEMSNFLPAGDYEHAGDVLEWDHAGIGGCSQGQV